MIINNSRACRVMIAGIGGASLGTEICKSLLTTGKYEVYGCDISPTAYGLYDPGFHQTFRVERENYAHSVIEACHKVEAEWLIPGGEEPLRLLSSSAELSGSAGIRLVANDPSVVALCSDKKECFKQLAAKGFVIPKTVEIETAEDIRGVGLPSVVKPSTGSGGSSLVFFATSTDEAMIYADFIRRSGAVPIAQEYIDDAEGEFTIGVLSLPNGQVSGSIALRRVLDAKLSVMYRGRGGIISSGYSQGYVDEYTHLCDQAERMAVSLGSKGPMNIQGRVREGILFPFEINPRFSASTFLRAMAGFNEIDLLLQYQAYGKSINRPTIRPGWYLRSLTERFVPPGSLK